MLKKLESMTMLIQLQKESDIIFVCMVKRPGFLSMIMATSQNMRTVIELHQQIGDKIIFIRLIVMVF